MPKVTESYKEEKRQALLQSAMDCFAERGFQATTIDDVAKHAGVSKGMVYTYFPSKEELFLQLMRDRTEQSHAQVQTAFAGCAKAGDKLRILMQRFRSFAADENVSRFASVQLEFWLYASRSPVLRPVLQEHYTQHVQMVTDIIQEGVDSGEFPAAVDVTGLTAVFWAVRDGVLLHSMPQDERTGYEQACDMIEHLLYSYLGLEA